MRAIQGMDEEGYMNKVADWFISKCTPNDADFDDEKNRMTGNQTM